MKLLNCRACGDIVALNYILRSCYCGSSSGKYRDDGLHAEFSGKDARVIGMLNSQVRTSWDMPTIPFETNYKWFPILADGLNHVHFVEEFSA